MLKEILSPESCKKCRICCVFDRDDIWEIPVFSDEQHAKIIEKSPASVFVPRGRKSWVYDMKFSDDGLAACPALSEKGCTLGENKPFDCKIWPFRVMERGGEILLTLAPLCEAVNKLDSAELTAFAEKLAPVAFAEAEKNPDIVKPYAEGYNIYAVKSRR